MGEAVRHRSTSPTSEGRTGVRQTVPADWYVDPADPQGAHPHSAQSLEDQATALLAVADDTSKRSEVSSETSENHRVDLFSSDPDVLKMWQAAAGQYGTDDDEGELAWQADALCAQTDPEAFFPEKGGSTRDAKRVCSECPVSQACLDYALARDERFGIWGGLSERERRRLRKRAS
ncbi:MULTISPECIES: WhiB family transcriptional regulator [Kocuria]|uniref:WhiB family transcriptional regulator n=1 Tax=Kocuria TaxID=57493 RepID=UPI000660C218|nr:MULTISPECIES: WhiB family transcriptional regulator [Kocuria]RUQ21228.1 WhiB family transcriptional regulator [Kocuria sp. HSID16901]